jgi:hypothetical protein
MKTRTLLAALLALVPSLAAAQTAVAIDPPAKLYTVEPGGRITAQIVVANPGAEAARIRVSLADWDYTPDGQPEYLKPGALPQSASPWITFSPATFVLKGKAKQVIRYTVEVPKGTSPGTHWATVLLEGEDPNLAPGAKLATFSLRVAHVVYVNVPPVRWDGAILGMAASPPKKPTDPVTLAIQYGNTGNGAYAVSGRLEVRDLEGKVVGQTEVDRAVVLPGATRVILGRFHGPLPAGDYVVLAVLNYGDPRVDVAGQTAFHLAAPLLAPKPPAEAKSTP